MKRHFTILLLCLLPCGLCATESPEFIQMIRSSQHALAKAKPLQAEEALIQWEKAHPDVRSNPTFCYQRFFVALEGKGDRSTARQMLKRLTILVDKGALSANSAEYLSVTEAWYRALFFTDSDLRRLAHKKMTERLAQNTP